MTKDQIKNEMMEEELPDRKRLYEHFQSVNHFVLDAYTIAIGMKVISEEYNLSIEDENKFQRLAVKYVVTQLKEAKTYLDKIEDYVESYFFKEEESDEKEF